MNDVFELIGVYKCTRCHSMYQTIIPKGENPHPFARCILFHKPLRACTGTAFLTGTFERHKKAVSGDKPK